MFGEVRSFYRRWPKGSPSSDAFIRSAVGVRPISLAMCLTRDLLRECFLSCVISSFVQMRRVWRLDFLAIGFAPLLSCLSDVRTAGIDINQ